MWLEADLHVSWSLITYVPMYFGRQIHMEGAYNAYEFYICIAYFILYEHVLGYLECTLSQFWKRGNIGILRVSNKNLPICGMYHEYFL